MHTFVTWALVALAVAALLSVFAALWVRTVRRRYKPRHPAPEVYRVQCRDGWELAVYRRRPAQRKYREPVLLCHGLATNRYTFDFDPPYSISQFLADAGFECFIVEWRGSGGSRRAPPGRRATDYSVDDHVRLDAPALVELALRESGSEQAFWLGHSLGGLVGYAAAQSTCAGKLRGLLALGSPVFFRFEPFLRSLVGLGVRAAWPRAFRQELTSAGFAPFLGYITLPLSDVLVNPLHIAPDLLRRVYANMMTSISRKVLLQFRDWIEHDAFRSFDGAEDWRAGLSRLELPVLVMGGSADKLAPPECVRKQFELLQSSPDKTLLLFGRDNGDAMDYGHGDLVFGTGAPQEVYPRIRAWLEERARVCEARNPDSPPTGKENGVHSPV